MVHHTRAENCYTGSSESQYNGQSQQDDSSSGDKNIDIPRDSVVHEDNRNINFADEQNNDVTLCKCLEHATKADYHHTKNGRWQFYVKDGIMIRYFASPIRSVKQLVVPTKFRDKVLQTVHDSIFTGHLMRFKTLARIQSQFH